MKEMMTYLITDKRKPIFIGSVITLSVLIVLFGLIIILYKGTSENAVVFESALIVYNGLVLAASAFLLNLHYKNLANTVYGPYPFKKIEDWKNSILHNSLILLLIFFAILLLIVSSILTLLMLYYSWMVTSLLGHLAFLFTFVATLFIALSLIYTVCGLVSDSNKYKKPNKWKLN